jgi:L-cysteine:1D-myo-inositol 2-amino-2-deoxy-alpha-D-glucopyranoside ligase
MGLDGTKMSKSDGNMIFVRDALKVTDPKALRWYLLDRHYRKSFDHDEAILDRARLRQKAFAEALGRGRLGPIARDSSSRGAMAALEDDLNVSRALAIMERAAPRAGAETRASFRAIGRLLGVV